MPTQVDHLCPGYRYRTLQPISAQSGSIIPAGETVEVLAINFDWRSLECLIQLRTPSGDQWLLLDPNGPRPGNFKEYFGPAAAVLKPLSVQASRALSEEELHELRALEQYTSEATSGGEGLARLNELRRWRRARGIND